MDENVFEKMVIQLSQPVRVSGKQLAAEGRVPRYPLAKEQFDSKGVSKLEGPQFCDAMVSALIQVQDCFEEDTDQYNRLGAVMAAMLHRRKISEEPSDYQELVLDGSMSMDDIHRELASKNIPKGVAAKIVKEITKLKTERGESVVGADPHPEKTESIVAQLLGTLSQK